MACVSHAQLSVTMEQEANETTQVDPGSIKLSSGMKLWKWWSIRVTVGLSSKLMESFSTGGKAYTSHALTTVFTWSLRKSFVDPEMVMRSGGVSCWWESQKEWSTVFLMGKIRDLAVVGGSTIPSAVSGVDGTDHRLAHCDCPLCEPQWEWCPFYHSTSEVWLWEVSAGSEWVTKFNSTSRTVDIEVHVLHISCVIITYTLESLSSLTQKTRFITHNL